MMGHAVNLALVLGVAVLPVVLVLVWLMHNLPTYP